MQAFITYTDLIGLGYTITTSADIAAANDICLHASNLVQNYCLQNFDYKNNIERHQTWIKESKIKLCVKQIPIVSVISGALYLDRTNTQDLTGTDFINNTNGTIQFELGGIYTPQFITSYNRYTVEVNYTSGFVATESYTIPASAPYTVQVDEYNGYRSTITLTPSLTYSVSVGTYTFSTADAGTIVTITYSYIPEDIRRATIVTCQSYLEDYFSAKKSGFATLTSMSDGQRSITKNRKVSDNRISAIPDQAQMIMNNYKRVR